MCGCTDFLLGFQVADAQGEAYREGTDFCVGAHAVGEAGAGGFRCNLHAPAEGVNGVEADVEPVVLQEGAADA